MRLILQISNSPIKFYVSKIQKLCFLRQYHYLRPIISLSTVANVVLQYLIIIMDVIFIFMSLRYGAFLLIVLMVLSITLNVSVQSEKYQREVAIKQHVNKQMHRADNNINSE